MDQYAPGFYLESPVLDPVSTRDGDSPIVRGGNVLNTAKHCRAAYRSYIYAKNNYPFVGLRLALAPVRDASSTTVQDPVGKAAAKP